MNKQILEQNLNDVVEGLKTMLSTASTELPAIFEEIVRWGIVSNSILAVSAFTFAMATLSIFVIDKKYGDGSGVFDGGVLVAASFLLIASLICLLRAIMDLSFALTSPKLYVIQYLKDFF